MSIRAQIALLFTVALLLLLSAAGWILHDYLWRALDQVEAREQNENIRHLAKILQQNIDEQLRATGNWANWNALDDYVVAPGEAFEQSSLDNRRFFDLLLVMDAQHRPLLLLPQGNKAISQPVLSPILNDYLQQTSFQKSHCDFIGLHGEQAAALVCLQPITRSDQSSSQSRGYLLSLHWLGQDWLDRLCDRLGMSVALVGRPLANAQARPVEKMAFAPGAVWVSQQDHAQRTVLSYQVQDFRGRPAFWLEFDQNKSSLQAAISTFKRVGLWVAIGFALALLLVYYLLSRALMRRLTSLKSVVQRARSQHRWQTIVPYAHERNEIGHLARSIHELFGEIGRNVKELESSSFLDELTKVPNRRYLKQQLNTLWPMHMRESLSLALLMVDIDYFKAFNDTQGHQAGDGALRRVAHCLRGALYRESDFVARYGGEEFVVILSNTDLPAALGVAERLRQAVESMQLPHPASKAGPFVSISIGVAAIMPQEGSKLSELLRRADAKLYMAKEAGRNRVLG